MKRLGPQHWIDAGLQSAAEEGIKKVNVESLATRLGVTKGSFYWHFKNRHALLVAMTEAWKQAQTTKVIEDVEKTGGTPAAILRNVIERIGKMNVPLEVAMRHWALTDKSVRKTVIDVDQTRIAHLQSIIERAGIPEEHARDRAHLLYYAFIGEVAFGRKIDIEDRATRLDSVHDMILRWP